MCVVTWAKCFVTVTNKLRTYINVWIIVIMINKLLWRLIIFINSISSIKLALFNQDHFCNSIPIWLFLGNEQHPSKTAMYPFSSLKNTAIWLHCCIVIEFQHGFVSQVSISLWNVQITSVDIVSVTIMWWIENVISQVEFKPMSHGVTSFNWWYFGLI